MARHANGRVNGRRRKAPPKVDPLLAALPEPPKLDAELGFTTTRGSRERIKIAAKILGKPLARYLRDVAEADAERTIEEYRAQGGSSQAAAG